MPDQIGRIPVPEIPTEATFPLTSDYPYGAAENPQIVRHQFGDLSAKVEQVFLLGNGARTFRLSLPYLSVGDKNDLASFWELNQGAFGQFTYSAPQPDGTFEDVVCRFKDSTLTLRGLAANLTSADEVELQEVTVDDGPVYNVSRVVDRFPAATGTDEANAYWADWLNEEQQLIPLVKITVRDQAYPVIYVSDRRCKVGGQLYLPRLIEFEGISQGMSGESDQATFTFGNADRVMTALSNDTNLFRARLQFSLYHVNSGTQLDLWQGDVIDWQSNASPSFSMVASDGLYELRLSYPPRKITRTCQKVFDNAENGCPFSTVGSLASTRTVKTPVKDGSGNYSAGTVTLNFAPELGVCDKGFDTPNGCMAHGMDDYFGGIVCHVETVRTLDNSSGFHGISRTGLTTVSSVADSIYGQGLQQIWCNLSDGTDVTESLPVNCQLAAGIDEGDFYNGLGIVAEGPLSDNAYPGIVQFNDPYSIDGQPNHGYVNPGPNGSQVLWGLRRSYGHDPVQDNDPDQYSQWFSLGQGGSGPQFYSYEKAAGVAFCEVRRKDAKGLQIDTLATHKMQVGVREGLRGYYWDDDGNRQLSSNGLTNPVWIMVNMVLRAKGLWFADAATQEKIFDKQSAIDAARICNLPVTKLIGGYTMNLGADLSPTATTLVFGAGTTLPTGLINIPVLLGEEWITIVSVDTDTNSATILRGQYSTAAVSHSAGSVLQQGEAQFTFNGVIGESKALKDWLQEVCNCFLGYYTFANGKLKIGVRENSSAQSAFTLGNILFKSLSLQSLKPTFDRITGTYADREFQFVTNTVDVYDETYATLIGSAGRLELITSNMNLVGVCNKSQAARIISTRLREELGGYTIPAYQYGREGSFKTTVLALDTEPGMICSLTHDDCPTYPATAPDNTIDPQPARPNYIEFRVTGWRLNKDYSVDIQFSTTHNDVYALAGGPKPADVQPQPLPVKDQFAPANWRFETWAHQDGLVRFNHWQCGSYGDAVHMARIELYYADETENAYGTVLGGLNDATRDTFTYSGLPPAEGEWIQVGDEIMEVVSAVATVPNFGNVTVKRGALGTVAAAHPRANAMINSISADWACELTLSDASNWRPGSALVVDAGTDPAPQKMVSEVLPGNVVRVNLPIDGAAAGDYVYQDPRLFRLKKFDYVQNFTPRFFSSPQRASFESAFEMPYAGIALIRAVLENTRGLESNWLTLLPTSSQRLEPKTEPYHPVWPYRVRTMGNARTLMPAVNVPTGVTDPMSVPTPTSHAQTFEWALATTWEGSANAIDTPPGVSSVVASGLTASGRIAFAGTVSDKIQVQIQIAGATETRSTTFVAAMNGVTDSTTMTALVQKIADWVNADTIGQYVFGSADGAVLSLTDFTGRGGDIVAVVNDSGLTAAPTGFASQLGILHGRRYALAWVGGGNRSDLSLISPTSGPTGDATRLEIHDLPRSADPQVTDLEIYAYADGDSNGPPYLVGTIANGAKEFRDPTDEATLTGLPQFTLVQPATSGPITITVRKALDDWFQLFIPKNTNISNQPHGFGLDPVQADQEINAKVDNEAGDGISLLIEFN